MKYILFWKGEEIDETDCYKDAKYLQSEYAMAYGGNVTIKRKKRD